MNKKTYLVLIILSVLTPYFLTVFFIRTSSILIILSLELFALITLIFSTTKYLNQVDSKKHRIITRLIALGTVIVFFVSYGLQLQIADYFFFKLREDRLNEFIFEIKDYGKITEMSDGQRFWKTLNNYSIEPELADVDTTKKYIKKYHLDYVLSKEQIEIDKYDHFRKRLIEVDLISFAKMRDGTVSFTIDGFLDNCQGYAFSESGKNPGSNNCGRIVYWKKIAKNWYVWYTT